MKNMNTVETKLNELGYTLGIYHPLMEKLSKKALKDVLDMVQEEHTDVDVKINRKLYVVEISTVNNEKDFNVLSQVEYIECYGGERWED